MTPFASYIKWRDDTIRKLETDLGDAVAARDDLEQSLAELTSELDEARAPASTAELSSNVLAQVESQTLIDAAVHARSIEADLKEADLLAMIDDLRRELAAGPDTSAEAGDNSELVALRQRVSIAEAEIEQLILAGLKADDETAIVPISRPESSVDLAENERLRAELLATQADVTQADVIKLKADVKAAKERLAQQITVENGQVSKPDNSAKLEQQLASTRSRVQQLNKALADAKLREVAIDLALISVVPSPSPPAPR